MYDMQSSFINYVPFVMEISHCATQLISQGNICIAERGDAAVTGGTTGIYSSSKWRGVDESLTFSTKLLVMIQHSLEVLFVLCLETVRTLVPSLFVN